MILFTSLSIILLCFFVFLNSIAVPDKVREQNVLGSIAKYFPGTKSASAIISGTKNIRPDIPIPELALDFPQFSVTDRYGFFDSLNSNKQLSIARQENGAIISIPGEELFLPGDDQIHAAFIPTLNEIAKKALQYDLQIEIEGHTDDVPIPAGSGGRFSSNWELSIARAVSVLRYFQDQGVPTQRLVAAGRAEFKPIADNTTTQGRAKNRRVVITLSEPKSFRNQ